MNKVKKFIGKIYFRVLYLLNSEKYKRKYPIFLKKTGVKIPDDYYEGGHGFIHPSVQFDGAKFGLVSIGKNTTMSFDVVLLTHDFSISKGLALINAPTSGRFNKPISIGNNCFIGMRSIILPGTTIGDNVIVGAGSVVKGNIPDNVIIAGNPAKILCNTEEWAKKHYSLHDYTEVKR